MLKHFCISTCTDFQQEKEWQIAIQVGENKISKRWLCNFVFLTGLNVNLFQTQTYR
jgi:hypothetical protein